MTSYRKYLKEMGVEAATDSPPQPEAVPIDQIGDDEMEVSYNVNEFLDQLGDVFPEAFAEQGYGPGEVRVKVTVERPESVVALMNELGFHGINESMFQRGTLNVNLSHNDAKLEWTFGIQDLEQ